jgi:hypothetical protein
VAPPAQKFIDKRPLFRVRFPVQRICSQRVLGLNSLSYTHYTHWLTFFMKNWLQIQSDTHLTVNRTRNRTKNRAHNRTHNRTCRPTIRSGFSVTLRPEGTWIVDSMNSVVPRSNSIRNTFSAGKCFFPAVLHLSAYGLGIRLGPGRRWEYWPEAQWVLFLSGNLNTNTETFCLQDMTCLTHHDMT